MSAIDRIGTGTPGGAGRSLTGLGELAVRARDAERAALLTAGGRRGAEVAESRAALEAAVADAVARGHPVADLAAAMAPAWGARARFGAMGRLAAACAPVAEVEEVLVTEGHELGGEMPADRSARLRGARARARADLDAAIRGAVIRGVPAREILGILAAGGLEADEGALAQAFEGHGRAHAST